MPLEIKNKSRKVFNKDQQLSHTIGNPAVVEFDRLWKFRTQDEMFSLRLSRNHGADGETRTLTHKARASKTRMATNYITSAFLH